MKACTAAVLVLLTLQGVCALDVGFSILTGNPPGTRFCENDIRCFAEAGAQYINTNQTFLTKLYQLKHIPPDSAISGATDTVHEGLLDICSHVAQAQISAIIVTRDKTPDADDIAGVASHATNPVMGVDLDAFGAGSRAFKMYPSAEDMNTLFIDVLSYFTWRNFILLYDDPTAYSNLLGMINHASNEEWNITSIRLADDLSDHARNISKLDTSNIFIFCSSEDKLQLILNQARELEILGPNYTWIVGNLNAIQLHDPLKLSELETTNAYIIHFQMNYTREMQYYLPLSTDYQGWDFRSKLTFDAVIALSHGLRTYRLYRELMQVRGNALPGDTLMPSCLNSGIDPTENPLSDHIKMVGFEGVTGNVAFDDNGDRVNYTISIYSGQGETLEQMRGEWTQNIDFWEQKWNTRWKSDGRLNVTAYNSKQNALCQEGLRYLKSKQDDKDSEIAALKAQIQKQPSTICDRYETCDECKEPVTEEGGPNCGWCSWEKRCTMYHGCRGSDITNEELFYGYSDDSCVRVITVKPALVPLDTDQDTVTITFDHLPFPDGFTYLCHFGEFTTPASMSGEDSLICQLPSKDNIPTIQDEETYVTVALSVSASNTDVKFVATSVDFFDCKKMSSLCMDNPQQCAHRRVSPCVNSAASGLITYKYIAVFLSLAALLL